MQNTRRYCRFYLFLIQRATSYKNTLLPRTHTYIRHIISAHCALSILLYCCVQSSTLTDMHARVLFSMIATQTLILNQHRYNSVWTSQYSVFCIQIFDIQPLPPSNSRSTATSWHALTIHPTLQRLVQCSTNISPASSLRQEPKSNPHHQSKPSNIFSATRIPHRQQQQTTKISILLADKCSSPIRWPSSMRIDSCRWTSSMRIDSCRWIVSCRRTSSMRIDSCIRIISCRRLDQTLPNSARRRKKLGSAIWDSLTSEEAPGGRGAVAKTDQLTANRERDLGNIHLRRGAGGGGAYDISNRTQTSSKQRDR